MNEKKAKNDSWIYYLQLGHKLPDYYISLAKTMNALGIDVIPVKSHQLSALMREEMEANLLVVITSLREKRQFEKYHKKTLGLLLKYGRLHIIHLSSFSERYYPQKSFGTKNYLFISLPIKLSLMAQVLIGKIRSARSKEDSLWPGGRGATLSKEVSKGS